MRKLSCLVCGGSGMKPDGTDCECNMQKNKADNVGLYYLPKTLRNLEFCKEFCINEKIYNIFQVLKRSKEFLQEVVIVHGSSGTSKVAFSYGLLNECYQDNLLVLPVLSLSELKQIITSKYSFTNSFEISLSDITNTDFLCIKIDSMPNWYQLGDLANIIGMRRNRLKGTLIVTSIKLKDLASIERNTEIFKGEGFNAKKYYLS